MSAQEQPQPAPDDRQASLKRAVQEWWACLKESIPESAHRALREKMAAVIRAEIENEE
jgi:hypothetical protein